FLINNVKFSQAAKIAFFLAIFQGIMPSIGWLLGNLMHIPASSDTQSCFSRTPVPVFLDSLRT
ncbi:MAG: hypothetical protein PF489_14505, partial [Salinivirgaceae bacterium]|nr:hypothetical protein [Salinivirgaceae bacterium]